MNCFKASIMFSALLLFAGMSKAQDEPIKNFSVVQVEKFITETLKTQIMKTTDAGANTVRYTTPNGEFDIIVRGGGAKSILFEYSHSTLSGALDKLNEWNSRGGCTYAYVRKNGEVVLTACLNLEAGMAYSQFTSFYSRIQQERSDFYNVVPKKQ